MRTVTVEPPFMDRYTDGQLRRLVSTLGKSIATERSPADLTFLVGEVPPSGIDFGPADRPLATLQIYAGNSVTGHRKLLWVETYKGQADKPWPMVVHALIDQFMDREAGKI